jgi:hypothetical protein
MDWFVYSPRCDNIGATYLSFEIDFHFIRGMVTENSLSIKISSEDQLANIFTKPLSSSCFSLLSDKLNVIPIPFSLRGCVRDISTHARLMGVCTTLPR